MRIVQASVAKRLAFAKWARLQGLSRHSSATWKVPNDVEVPAEFLVGAQIDGKAAEQPKKVRATRSRKKAEPQPEPVEVVQEPQEEQTYSYETQDPDTNQEE